MATNNLKEILQKHGIRQTELASISGLSVSMISRTVNNRADPTPTTQAKVAKAVTQIAGVEVLVEEIFPSSRK